MASTSFQHQFIDGEPSIKFRYAGRTTKPLTERQLVKAIRDIEGNEEKFKSLNSYKDMLGIFLYALTLLRIHKVNRVNNDNHFWPH